MTTTAADGRTQVVDWYVPPGSLNLDVELTAHALLAGALGLFAILAVAMVLTRKVDGYQAT